MGRILFCMFHGKGRLLPNHDLLFAKYAITLQKKNPEIPKTIRNQSLLVSVRRKSITGNDRRDKKAGGGIVQASINSLKSQRVVPS